MRTSIYALLAASLIILAGSCSEEEKALTCAPSNARIGSDSIVYQYNASVKLTAMLHFEYGRRLTGRDDIKYDANGRPNEVVSAHVLSDGEVRVFETHKLFYSSDGKLSSLNSWSGPTATGDPFVTSFTHDTKGRISVREMTLFPGVTRTYRYEYDAKDNVTSVYFRNYSSTEEVLGQQYTAFDAHERFFAGSDALKLINLYVYGYEPSRNNKTRAVITYTNPSTWFSAPVIVNYTMTYDDQGFVNSLSSDSFSAGDAPFYSINYECQ